MFALDVAKVREVLDFTTITKIPRTPEFMRGVINLRGNVVPVVDLRLGFGMSKTEKTVNTCIIVVEVELEGESTVIGALADSVEEVIDLEPDQIEPPPRIGTGDQDRFHPWHGEAGLALHHDSGHRQGLLRRRSGPVAGRTAAARIGCDPANACPGGSVSVRSAGTDLPAPGQMCFCERPSRVETVLGSCVAVTMWNARLADRVYLSRGVAARAESRNREPLKYVDSSIHTMLRAMEKHASRRSEIEVKLFGGASMRRMAAGRRQRRLPEYGGGAGCSAAGRFHAAYQ